VLEAEGSRTSKRGRESLSVAREPASAGKRKRLISGSKNKTAAKVEKITGTKGQLRAWVFARRKVVQWRVL